MKKIYKLLCLILMPAILVACSTKTTAITLNPDDPLDGILPDAFAIDEAFNEWETFKIFSVVYEDGDSGSVCFSAEPVGGTLMLDIEDAEVTRFRLKGHDAVIVNEGVDIRLLWMDEDLEVFFCLITRSIEQEQVLSYAEAFIDSLYS